MYIYRVCQQSRCISLLNLIGCNKPNVKWNGMELKGVMERHLIARLLDISAYMGVHIVSTMHTYTLIWHKHTHTHTQGKIFMFDGAFYVLRDFRFVLLLMMLRLNWITDQDCRGQKEERGEGGGRWLRVAISGIWINKFKTCISPFDLHSHLSRRIALLFCRIHFHFRFRPLPASFAICHMPLAIVLLRHYRDVSH